LSERILIPSRVDTENSGLLSVGRTGTSQNIAKKEVSHLRDAGVLLPVWEDVGEGERFTACQDQICQRGAPRVLLYKSFHSEEEMTKKYILISVPYSDIRCPAMSDPDGV